MLWTAIIVLRQLYNRSGWANAFFTLATTKLGSVHMPGYSDHGRKNHDGGCSEDSAGCGLVNSKPGSSLGFAQRGDISFRLSLSDELLLIIFRKHRPNIDTLDDLVAAHKIGVETGSCGDRSEGDESTEDVAGRGCDVKSRNNSVEAEGDGARGSDGGEVRLDHDLGRHRRRLVTIGSVEGDVEGLVENLPAHNANCAHARLKHTSSHDKVGQDIAGHSEGKENGLAGVCCTISLGHHLLGRFESGLAREESSGDCAGMVSSSQVKIPEV
ncbi:hypothetical protein HG530_003540 [Fusarium avenaceum]|nr:hypothetical protein HG530_003540 [Fusarium avenaceum]